MTANIGHIIGVIAIILFFISYQIHDKKKLIIVQSIATGLMTLQYLLIGAYSGFTLNVVCLVRNGFFYHRDKKMLSGIHIPIIFAVIIAGVSVFSWDGPHALLLIAGLIINTICFGLCSTQNLRKSIVLTCTMVIIYNIFAGAYTGIISESISIISAVIGIIRYNRETKGRAS